MDDKNPPSYVEAIGLHSIIPTRDEPSAPLIDPASNLLFNVPILDEALDGLSQTLKYTSGSDNDYVAFYVRDTIDCLYFKGMRTSSDVISLHDVSHRLFLRIAMTQVIGTSKKFVVSHNDIKLATIQMTGLDAGNTTIIPTLGIGTGDYKIQSHGGSGRDTDIVVLRKDNTLLCKIHIPHTTSTSTGFDASMLFPAIATTTNFDKCICLALPTIFMMIRRMGVLAEREKTIRRANVQVAVVREADNAHCQMVFICAVIVVFVCVLGWFIYAVTTKNCDAKPWPSKHCPRKG